MLSERRPKTRLPHQADAPDSISQRCVTTTALSRSLLAALPRRLSCSGSATVRALESILEKEIGDMIDELLSASLVEVAYVSKQLNVIAHELLLIE